MEFGKILHELRRQHGYTQQQLASSLSLAKSTVCMYERGERIPPYKTMRAIADLFGVDMNRLYGRAEADAPGLRPVSSHPIPMLGRIACGEPIFAEQEQTYVMADDSLAADFCLIARGDSMIGARIYDGDTVFIRRQPTVENGQIAAVIIGEEATLKRWYFDPGAERLELHAENPAYPPLVYTREELAEVRCLGLAVGLMARF